MMPPEITIIYGESHGTLTDIVRVPWEDRLCLRRTGVVAISLIHASRPHPTKRYQQAISLDIYHLIWTDTDCYLGGHTEDFLFCKLTETGENRSWRFPYILPKNCMEFEGIYVSKEAWHEARKIYADPNGLMF